MTETIILSVDEAKAADEAAFAETLAAERLRFASLSIDEAAGVLSGFTAAAAMANRKMFQTSFLVRWTMGAALDRLYRLAASAASAEAKDAASVELPRILTVIVKGWKVTADAGVKKGSYDPSMMYGLSWDTLYDNWDLYRFGTDAKRAAWQDHAEAKGLSVNSTKEFTKWCRQTMNGLTAQARAAATKADEAAEAKATQADAIAAAETAKAEAATKLAAKAEAAKAEAKAAADAIAALPDDYKVTSGKQGITMLRLRNLTPADRLALRDALNVLIADDVIAAAAAAEAEAKRKADEAAAAQVVIDTAAAAAAKAAADEAKAEAANAA
jgi:hypothetical protein